VDRVQRPHAVTIEQRALDQNLDLDAALARVRQTRAAASGAGAELLPTATFEHQSLRGEFDSVAAGSPGFKRDGHTDVVGRQRAGKSISSAGYAEARRRLEMTHRRLNRSGGDSGGTV
jgi:outer membrane protein TolC